MRIAIGGIRHETNTFSPVWTTYEDFRTYRGETLLNGGLDELCRANDVEPCPTFVASALPSGTIRKDSYLRLKSELLHELEVTLPVDGVYLDLHGAMHVQEIGDGESDLIPAVRALVGEETAISVSLDLHGNISPNMVDHAQILTALRTAPHRDGQETRRRALALLSRALRAHEWPVAVLVKPPLLLAGESAMTDAEPARSLYGRLGEIERMPGLLDASLLIGCAWTDGPYTSTSVIVVAQEDRALAQQLAAQLAAEVWARRHDFGFGIESADIDPAIRQAMSAPQGPVILSDSGDNVTAGGAGDIPLLAERLLALGAQDAVVAGLSDAEAVRQCAAAGIGAEVMLSVGGKLDRINGKHLSVLGRVEHLATGSQDPGKEPTMVTVRVGGVRLILAVDRRPFVDRASIAAAGVDPMSQQIVVVKQGYVFPDLYDHAPRTIMALSPGATSLRLEELPFHHLSRPIYPLDGDFTWAP